MKAAERFGFEVREKCLNPDHISRYNGADPVSNSGGVSGRGTARGKHGSLLYYYAQIALAMGFS